MSPRVVVAFATRAGSTGEVAQAIGEVLSRRGCSVTVSLVRRDLRVAGYDAVLIGSGVRSGSWLPQAVAFVTDHQYALRRVPVALFRVHLNNTGTDAQSVANREACLEPVRALLQPVAEEFFTGAVDPAKLSVLERIMLRRVQAPACDYRDWRKIQEWAETIFV